MSRRLPYKPDPRAAQVDVTLIDDGGQSLFFCLEGRMPLQRALRILPRHAEVVELDDGRLIAFLHLGSKDVRPLLDRLHDSPYRVGFSRSPQEWAAGLRM